jgi:peptidyl-tRNA hydrolase, PTH1 family
MNLSGIAVKAVFREYAISQEDLLVVCDDLDLEFGRLKLKARGSSGGHKGIASIIEALGSDAFARLRIGIGRPLGKGEPREYVLSAFNKKEKTVLKSVVERACLCCISWAAQGSAAAMNTFNKNAAPFACA